jgi:hypothetical protein
MSQDLSDYYATVGYLRATGMDEAHAHTKAEEVMMGLNEWHLVNILTDVLGEYAEDTGTTVKIRTYEEAGLLTQDTGLVVDIEGSRFQLTIVKA